MAANLNKSADGEIKVTVSLNGEVIKEGCTKISGSEGEVSLSFDEISLWEPSNPVLYDLTFELEANGSVDKGHHTSVSEKFHLTEKHFVLTTSLCF